MNKGSGSNTTFAKCIIKIPINTPIVFWDSSLRMLYPLLDIEAILLLILLSKLY